MAIDWSKPIQTDEDDPRSARVLCTDYVSPHGLPVVAAVMSANGTENLWSCSLDGSVVGDAWRFRNVPEKLSREVWVNLYQDCAYGYSSRKVADVNRSDNRLACIKTTITGHVGQFDE